MVSYFRGQGQNVSVLIGWEGPTSLKAVSDYQALGCNVDRVPTEFAYRDTQSVKDMSLSSAPCSADKSKNGNPFVGLKRVIRYAKLIASKSSLLKRSVDAGSRLSSMIKVRRYARQLLEENTPKCLFQGPFHSIGKFDNALYLEAEKLGVSRYCYPVSAYHGRDNVLNARHGNIQAGMLDDKLWCDYDLWNKTLAFLMPSLVRGRKGRSFFIEDPFILLAAIASGTSLEDPWQKPQPGFEKVFVYSSFSAALLDDGTFPMSKVSICGIPLLDSVIENLKDDVKLATVYDHIGVERGEAFILFNVEPSLEHHYAQPDKHWRNFEEMMEVATSFGVPVVLSLHPLCNYEDYKFAEEGFGVSISTKFKIHTLYPLASIVLSFPCSTNIMAEIFARPLVIYDLFGIASKENGRERVPVAVCKDWGFS
ncbi:MAG: hypothetical protein ACMZ66_16325 [Thalassospira sp.]|uniref:hypothetical protein n=1 Tax=Thalassospira sp. TaxID=1912094 RepID=UPI003A8B1873